MSAAQDDPVNSGGRCQVSSCFTKLDLEESKRTFEYFQLFRRISCTYCARYLSFAEKYKLILKGNS